MNQLADQHWPRFGAFSYDFQRGQLDQLISSFQKTGLTAVQLGQGLLDEAIDDPRLVPVARRKLADAGTELVGLAGYQNLVAPDPGQRRRNIDFLARCVELAPDIGTTVVAMALSVLIGAITAVVQAALIAVIYIDLRMRTEGLDLELERHVEARDAGRPVTDPYLPAPEHGPVTTWS